MAQYPGRPWLVSTIVPEDQLHDKIMEYSEYIKFVILALVAIAVIYFGLKYLLKKKSNANRS